MVRRRENYCSREDESKVDLFFKWFLDRFVSIKFWIGLKLAFLEVILFSYPSRDLINNGKYDTL